MEAEEQGMPPEKPSEMTLHDYVTFGFHCVMSRHNQEENVAELIDHVLSNDPDLQLKACCMIRKLFFMDEDPNPLLKELIEADNFVPCLVSFLNPQDLPQLQYEAASILVVFSEKSEYLSLLVHHGVVPALAKLLHAPHDISRMAFFTLGNIAHKSQQLCDLVVFQHDVLRPLLYEFIPNNRNLQNLRVATMVLSQCRKAIPQMESMMVEQLLDMLQLILQGHDDDIDIAADTACTFASLPSHVLYQDSALDHTRVHTMLFGLLVGKSPGAVIYAIAAMLNIASVSSDDQLQREIKMNILQEACTKFGSICDTETHRAQILKTPELCGKLIDILRHGSRDIVIPVLNELARIAGGDEHQIQFIMNIGAMPQILRIILNEREGDGELKNLAIKVASKVVNGSINHIQEFVCHGMLYVLVIGFGSFAIETKKEVGRAILKVTSHATPQVMKIVMEMCAKPLCEMVNESSDLLLTAKCLEGIDRITKQRQMDQAIKRNPKDGYLLQGIIAKLLKLFYGIAKGLLNGILKGWGADQNLENSKDGPFIHGILPPLLKVLYADHYDYNVISGVCKLVTTIADGGQTRDIVVYGILYGLVDLFGRSPTEIKEEAATTILHVISRCDLELIRLVSAQCFKPLLEMLEWPNSEMKSKFLKSLKGIADVWNSDRGDVAVFLKKIEEAGGIERIRKLQYDKDPNVSVLAKSLLNTYWP